MPVGRPLHKGKRERRGSWRGFLMGNDRSASGKANKARKELGTEHRPRNWRCAQQAILIAIQRARAASHYHGSYGASCGTHSAPTMVVHTAGRRSWPWGAGAGRARGVQPPRRPLRGPPAAAASHWRSSSMPAQDEAPDSRIATVFAMIDGWCCGMFCVVLCAVLRGALARRAAQHFTSFSSRPRNSSWVAEWHVGKLQRLLFSR